jgi:hypothetical protein
MGRLRQDLPEGTALIGFCGAAGALGQAVAFAEGRRADRLQGGILTQPRTLHHCLWGSSPGNGAAGLSSFLSLEKLYI